MLKKILDQKSCGKCRVCCGFIESDKWEIPLVFDELKACIAERYPEVKLTPRGNEHVFDMQFDGDRVIFCPMLTDTGCILGDDKPFDCRIWPFRVNSFEGRNVITVSPVCGTVSELPLRALTEFVQGEFAKLLFDTARAHPDMVKPYIDGYPIVAVDTE